MIQIGEYSDTLRALGRFLDDAQAYGIAITGRGEEWEVMWDRAGTTRFQKFQLEALRAAARQHRGLEGDLPRLTTSQMLRALGDVLDSLSATGFAILELSDGYQLTATVEGQEIVQTLSLDEIRALVSKRLEGR